MLFKVPDDFVQSIFEDMANNPMDFWIPRIGISAAAVYAKHICMPEGTSNELRESNEPLGSSSVQHSTKIISQLSIAWKITWEQSHQDA